MRLDSQLAFVPLGSPLSLVGSTGATFASSVIDLTGAGSGNAPPNIIGNVSLFGQDPGVGDGLLVPKLIVAIGTALVTADSCTLQAALQAAPDTGSGGGYVPGSWQTLIESAAISAAQGVAGAIIARFDWPPVFPATLRPRFFRLLFSTPSGEQFSAGTIAYAYVTSVRDDQANAQAANNYVVK